MELKPVQVAVYARVSTTDQDAAMQVRENREYASRRNWTIYGEYVDTGWSGAVSNRPALNRLMADAQMHRFDIILVWKLDRFGRSLLNLCEALKDLTSYGVRFVAVSQGIDTDQSNPTSKLLLHVMAAVAEFEREIIRERVAAGMRNAKAKGKRIGRPPVVVDRVKVIEMRSAGKTFDQISQTLGISPATACRLTKKFKKAAA